MQDNCRLLLLLLLHTACGPAAQPWGATNCAAMYVHCHDSVRHAPQPSLPSNPLSSAYSSTHTHHDAHRYTAHCPHCCTPPANFITSQLPPAPTHTPTPTPTLTPPLPAVDPKDPEAVPEPTLPGLDVTLSDIQDALRGARERVDEARIAAMDDMGSSAAPGLLRGPAARFSDGITGLISRGDGAQGALPTPPKLPSLQDLAKGLNLTELAQRAANVSSLAELAKQLNVESFNPAELAKLNISSVGELLRNLNTTAALPPVDVAATIGKVGERIMSILPRLPDPLYLAGLRLDPQALADADLPAATSVPQLFGSLMSKTMGE